jgi:hypothetical protein
MPYKDPEKEREYQKKWRAENQEKSREASRKWYAENQEKNRESSKKWRAENPERAREHQKKWREANPEKNRESSKKWRAENPEKAREQNTIKNRIWRAKNPGKVKESVRKWQKKNPTFFAQYRAKYSEQLMEKARIWRANNREKIKIERRKWKKYKRATSPNFRLTENMRTALCNTLQGRTKSSSTMKIIGCTSEELFEHFELCSTWESWMTRENYGKGGWDVDHIVPISKWNYDCPLQFALCWEKSNLQPLEHIANIKKGAR